MLKRMVFPALPWLMAVIATIGTIVAIAYQQHRAREGYQAQGTAECAVHALSSEEKHTCEKEAQSRKDYSPWWGVLVAWPEGVTTWAIIFTGFVIAWQSSETRKAAEAAAEGVALGGREFISTFRPTIRIRLIAIEENKGETNISIRMVNVGGTDAHITKGEAVLTHNFGTEMLKDAVISSAQISPRILKTGEYFIHQISLGKTSSTTARTISTGHDAEGAIHCRGFVQYEDGNRTTRTTEWLRKLDSDLREFRAMQNLGDSPHDYED